MLETWKKWVIPCSSTNLLGMLLLMSSGLMQLIAVMQMLLLLLREVPPAQAAWAPHSVPPVLGLPASPGPCSRPSVLTAGLSFLPQA